MERIPRDAKKHPFLIFRAGGLEMAIPGPLAREILRVAPGSLRRSRTPGRVRFEIESQGSPIPVVSVRAYLGLPERPVGSKSYLLVLREPCVALLIDSVSRVENLADVELTPTRARLNGKWRDILDVQRLSEWALENESTIVAG